MKIKTEKIYGPINNIIDPAYWEPSFPLFFGGEGGGGGGGESGADADASASGINSGGGTGGMSTSGSVSGGGSPDSNNRSYNKTIDFTPETPTVNPLQSFLDALGSYNSQFLNAGYAGLDEGTLNNTNTINTNILNQLANLTPAGLAQSQEQTQSIAQALQNIGSGVADPRFEAYNQAQQNLLENQRQGELARISESLSRRGLGGSAAELNAASAINNQYNQQAQSLSSQLGLQSLGRQDTALQNALAAYGQSANLGIAGTQLQSGLLGQQAGLNQQNFANVLAQLQSQNQAKSANLEALTAGLQNLTIPYALETARTAAENAGESPDSGGGLFGNLFG